MVQFRARPAGCARIRNEGAKRRGCDQAREMFGNFQIDVGKSSCFSK